MSHFVGPPTPDPLDRLLGILRKKLRRRTVDGRCVLCGIQLDCALHNDRPMICDDCIAPDSLSVVKLAESIGLIRQCRYCGERVANMDIHLDRKKGDSRHPPPMGKVPRTAYWIVRLLDGRGGWSGGDAR